LLSERAQLASPESVLRQLTDSLAHRGPDDSGTMWEATNGVGLGHRRLAIVDLSPTGRQPMTSQSQRYTIVFNGEVYNFNAIRAEIEALADAPRFHGSSDTEVMLAAVEAWGLEQAVRRFVGMFAFALWDRRERRLSLCRDRLGVKPLYYHVSSAGLCFGSELRALRAFPLFDHELDEGAVYSFLRFGYVPAPKSIYRNTHKLEPGCILHVTSEGIATPELVRYWDAQTLPALAPVTGDDATLLGQLEDTLRSAVQLRMIADVPLGAFLSGGIDSSLVVALMQAQSARRIRTFSIANESAEYDEGRAAARVAGHLGTAHTVFSISAQDALDVVPELGSLFDEPFADSSQIPTLLVSRLARRQVTVALTGDGGDEVFGGYNRHVWAPRVWRFLRLMPASSRASVSRLLLESKAMTLAAIIERALPPSARPRLLKTKVQKLLTVAGSSTPRELYRALCSQWQRPEELLGKVLNEVTPENGPTTPSYVGDIMLLDLMTYLPDDVLTKVDRATMSVALEARAPFLDHRVVELAWRLPPRLKIRDGVGKWALRNLLYRYVPRRLVDRPKMGFSIPIGDWLRGPLRAWAETLLLGDVPAEGRLEPDAVKATWHEHLSGAQDHSARLWTVLMFQSWLNDAPRLKPASDHRS